MNKNIVIIDAANIKIWREKLAVFTKSDICQTPEYHLTYSGRTKNSKPVLWCYEEDGDSFAYPFLLTPVILASLDGSEDATDYSDISSIYGYSGPLSTTDDDRFLARAWAAFDGWAREQNIIAEFTRFSVYVDNRSLAHKDTIIEQNRLCAVSQLPETEDELFSRICSKTRNMIRKAKKEGLIACELDLADNLPACRKLYSETMTRNESSSFFLYNDEYYNNLMALPEGELRLFGVFYEDRLIAVAMAIIYRQGALYHLGASLAEYSRLGAGNLVIFEMSKKLMQSGVKFITVGGGRTTSIDDPLLRFKKNNSTDLSDFYIGKRIVDPVGYSAVKEKWKEVNNQEAISPNLIFYR